MKTAIIIQARMASERLPGKVLRHVAGKPLLQYQLERLEMADLGMPWVVATSNELQDDPIADFCAAESVECFRENHLNVAARFMMVAIAMKLDAFVRLCGDSPLIDGNVISKVADMMDKTVDLATNVHPRSFPQGQSVEMVRTERLCEVCANMDETADREHVTRYFYRHADRFNIANLWREPSLAGHSLAVDSEEDFKRFTALINHLGEGWISTGFETLVEAQLQLEGSPA